MNEQELDRLLEQECASGEDPGAERSFQKKVKRAMNRTLYRRIFASLLVVALAGAGLWFGTSAAINAIFYDPGDEPAFLEDDRPNQEFGMLFESVFNMYFPGTRCIVVGNRDMDSFTPTGFSGYDVDVTLEGAFDRLHVGGQATHTFHIRRSRLDGGAASLSFLVNEFLDPERQADSEVVCTTQELRAELEDLPASARLDVSLSFGTYQTADQVAQLIRDYPDASVQWAALKGQESGYYIGLAGGMNLEEYCCRSFREPQAQRYEGYYLPVEGSITGADLERCLIAQLRLLADHPDFLRMMESLFPHQISPEIIQERLDRAEQEWSCYGLRLMVGQKDLLRLLDEQPVTQAVVQDVRVSRFQRSH